MSRVTTSGRVFMRDGQRWFWMADTSWRLWIKRTREEVVQYLDKRAAQGFNAVQAVAIRPPGGNFNNAYGNPPYNGSLSSPGEAYFQHVDYAVDQARQRGMVVVMLPIWSLDQVGSILTESNAFGYGQFLANRYASYENIVWMLGGDDTGSGRETIWANLAAGLDSGPGDNIQTFHPAGRKSSTEWFNSAAWLDYHTIQTGAYTTWSTARSLETTAYGNTGGKPWINGEPFYEDHNINWDNSQGFATAIYARRDAYWAVLAGAAGHTYGCWPVVHFARQNGDPYDGVHGPWQNWMDVEGANQMRHVRALFESRPRLEPQNSLVTNPGSTNSVEWTPAASDAGNTTLIAYFGNGGSRTVNLATLAGSRCRPWWYNPRTGATTQLADRDSTGTASFTSPTSGEDWALVIDDVAAGYSAPGQLSPPPPPPASQGPTFGTTIGSGGFRFYDANHEVSYNYVEGVYGGNFQGPLLIDTGDAEGSSTNLSGHWRVVNALVERNVLIGNPEGVRIGDNYNSAPTGCTIRDNVVSQAATGQAVTQRIAPVNTTLSNNDYYATPSVGGLVRDSAQIWRKPGYGPRLTFLQAADVGVSGDLNDADGTGALVGGGPGPGPDPGPDPEPPPPTDNTTAAGRFGWGQPLPVSDEFDYTGPPNPAKWALPGADWAGHAGNGTRDPERVEVRDGRLIMTGTANGSSGWMKHKFDQQYGRYEGRCRSFETSTSGSGRYHPLLLIWPTSESRQNDGEYDWLEDREPGGQSAGHFIHYPHPGTSVVQQEGGWDMYPVDQTQWHNYAIEWTPDHIRVFVDGNIVKTYSGGANSVRRNIQDMPSGHVNIQLDNFTGNSGLRPATFEVEWLRVYTLTPTGPIATPQTVTASGIPTREAFGFPTITGAEPEPPPNSHPTLLGTTDTILGTATLGRTPGEGPPPPTSPPPVTGAGRIPSGQAFGLPLISVADGPQDVRAVAIDSAAAFGRPTVAAAPPPPTAPGGVLVPSVWAVGQDGKLTPLPAWTKLSVSPVRNSMGAFQIEYPADAAGFSALHEGVSAHPLRALEVRIWLGGSQEGALGGWLVQKAGDDLTPGSRWTFTGHFHEWLLSKALIAPQARNEANKKGELRFQAATAGLVLSTIMDQAQARGALPLVTRDFSVTHDSNGRPWPTTVSSFNLAPKTTVLQVADKLVELGMCEFEVTAARVWRAFVPGSMGEDRTTGLTPLTFGHAVNLTQHSRRESAKDAGTAVLAAGSEGFYSWAESATAKAELGWRAEVAADAGQLSSETAVQAYAATTLEAIRNGVAEFVGEVEFATGVPLPIVGWGIGDWAYTWVGTKRRKLRIAQVGLEFTAGQPPRGTVALNDLIADKVAALYRRLDAISAGDAVVGTSVPSDGGTGEDRVPPAAPTGLTLSSTIAYQVPGETLTLALVTAGWAPVLTDAYPNADTADKARAAALISGRLATTLASGGAVEDPAKAGRVEAATLIANRLRRSLDGEPNSEINEDWTWPGAPAVVNQHNDGLLGAFLDEGFSGENITRSEAARDWLEAFAAAGGSTIFTDWTWDNAPLVVIQHAAALQDEFEQENPSNLPPLQTAVRARDWLAAWPVAHLGGGAVTGDVDHYRLQFAYLGAQTVAEPAVPEPTVPLEDTVTGTPLWSEPAGSPTRDTSMTFSVEGGRSLGVRVAAVDRAGNQSPWTPVVAVDTASDDQPPPAPSAPVGAAWFRTIDWTWDGKGSAGEDMLAAAPDFASGGSVEIHAAEGIDFLPDRPLGPDGRVDLSQSTTFVAHLYAAGTWNQAGLTIGKTYFARLVAVDRNGNASDPSATSNGVQPQQLVNIDIGPGAIDRLQIIDGEIVRAKIADAAINSAKVEEIEVGKLTAGTMNAQVVVGGRFSTPTVNGNKLEFDNAGIRLYQGNTVVGRWQVSDASMLVTGTYLSGLNGRRINILSDGTMRFYPPAGDNFSQMTNDGQNVVWRGPVDNNGRSGRLNVNVLGVGLNFSSEAEVPNNLRSEIVLFDRRTRITAPFTHFEVNERLATPDGSDHRVMFSRTDSGGNAGSFLSYMATPSGDPTFVAGAGAALIWSNPAQLQVKMYDGGNFGDWVNIHAAGFVTVSSETVKTDIEDIRAVLDPLEAIRQARARKFVHLRAPTDAPRVGVLAEELPEIITNGDSGQLSVDIGQQVAVLWGAFNQLLDQEIVSTSGTVVLPQSQLGPGGIFAPGVSIEVPVTWESAPPAAPTGGFVQIHSSHVWGGRVTAWLKTGSVTDTGAIVVFKNISSSRVVVNEANDNLRVSATAIGLGIHIPPYVPSGEEPPSV